MENQDFTEKNVACKSLKVKLLRSLGNDLTPLLTEALKYSVHPTLEDAALELSRSELLFVALLQALTSKNTVMSGRLLLEAQGWELLPRLSGYMGGKLRTEFNCTNEFVGGAAAFAHTLQDSGLMKVPKKYLKYLDYLAENVREEIEARERSSRRQDGAVGPPQEADGQENLGAIPKRDGAAGPPQEADGQENLGAIPKRSRRRGQRQRRTSGTEHSVQGKPTTSQEPQTHDQAVQSESATAPLPTNITSSQAQINPTTATSPMQSTAASTSSQAQAVSATAPSPTTSMPSIDQALFAAVERDDPEATRDALDSRADINGRNSCGFTPLHVAAAKEHFKAMAVLLKRGASTGVDGHSTGDRPLHTAAANGMDQAVALLLVAGADLNARDQGGLTPVQRAAGRISTVALLRPPANYQVGRGRAASDAARKALRDAVGRNDPQAARAAIENGADIEERRGGDGWIALHLAARYGRVQVSCVLLRAGADKEAVDSGNDRPLHLAAALGRDGAVALLAVAGADLHSRGWQGRTPLQRAVHWGHTSTAALLRALGG